MAKKMIDELIETLDAHYFNDDLDALINRLQRLQTLYVDKGYVDLRILVGQDYYYTYVSLNGRREETEKEYLLRKQEEEKF